MKFVIERLFIADQPPDKKENGADFIITIIDRPRYMIDGVVYLHYDMPESVSSAILKARIDDYSVLVCCPVKRVLDEVVKEFLLDNGHALDDQEATIFLS